MKRSSSVRHLTELAEVASEGLRCRDGPTGWPLVSIWVTGELLSSADTVEDAAVVLLLDLPADELPWIAVHPTAERVSERLRLGKRPVLWGYRPQTWPAWNVTHRRVVRFWAETRSMPRCRTARMVSVRAGCPNLPGPDYPDMGTYRGKTTSVYPDMSPCREEDSWRLWRGCAD
jgi:hypothetical protein